MLPSSAVPTRSLQDDGESFDVTVLEAEHPQRLVVVALVGGQVWMRVGEDPLADHDAFLADVRMETQRS